MTKDINLKHYVMLKEIRIDDFNRKANELIEKGFLPFQDYTYKINKYDTHFFAKCFISEELFRKIENIKKINNNNKF